MGGREGGREVRSEGEREKERGGGLGRVEGNCQTIHVIVSF